MKREKEYLYVGHYIDIDGNYILKVGTTNDLDRRRYQHNQYYRKKATHHRMPKEEKFTYDWFKEFSQSNTKRYEKETKMKWIEEHFGEFVKNDRFACDNNPKAVEITIRKTYKITL